MVKIGYMYHVYGVYFLYHSTEKRYPSNDVPNAINMYSMFHNRTGELNKVTEGLDRIETLFLSANALHHFFSGYLNCH
jgi:hypothetical protein